MEWYYSVNGQQVGPVSDADLENLVTARVVGQESLVWHAGMPEWQTLRQVKPAAMAVARADRAAEPPQREGRRSPWPG